MGTSEVQAVFDLLYAFLDDVSRVTGVRMPSCMDPQYPYGQAETEASLAKVLSDQQALAWRAHELWQRDAAAAGLHPQEAAPCYSIPCFGGGPARRVGPAAPPARDTRGGAGAGPLRTIGGAGCRICSSMDGDTGVHQRVELCPVGPVVRTRPGVGEGALGGLRRH